MMEVQLCSWSAGVCEDGTAATHTCKECSKNLCPGCREHHGRETKAHSVLPLPLDGGSVEGAPGGEEASAGKEEEKATEGAVEDAGRHAVAEGGDEKEEGADGGGAVEVVTPCAELLKICESKDAPDMDRVRELLSVDTIDFGVAGFTDENGSTALMWALCHPPESKGHAEIVQAMMVEREPGLLIDHCREVNTYGKTLLAYASEFGHTAIVRLLLEVDPSVEHVRTVNNEGCTGLMFASDGGHVDSVQALLKADPSVGHVRMVNDKGDTGLMVASIEGHADIAQLLLEVDPSVEHVRTVNNKGDTGLILAAWKGHAASVRLLLEADPSVEHVRMANINGETSLITASVKGYVNIVRLLLGMDPSMEHLRMVWSEGRSAIHNAALTGQHECMSLLLEAGADVNATDNKGWSALYLACEVIMLAAEQVETQDGMNNPNDPTRCLVVLLQSRKLTVQNINHTIFELRRHMPSAQQVDEAEAGGTPLTIVHKGAMLALPVLRAQRKGEFRWCAHCLRLTPDVDLNRCGGCKRVGYCEESPLGQAKPCHKAHWKAGHKQECMRFQAEAKAVADAAAAAAAAEAEAMEAANAAEAAAREARAEEKRAREDPNTRTCSVCRCHLCSDAFSKNQWKKGATRACKNCKSASS